MNNNWGTDLPGALLIHKYKKGARFLLLATDITINTLVRKDAIIEELFKMIIKSNAVPFVIVEGNQLLTFHFLTNHFTLLVLLQFAKIKELTSHPDLLSTGTSPDPNLV